MKILYIGNLSEVNFLSVEKNAFDREQILIKLPLKEKQGTH